MRYFTSGGRNKSAQRALRFITFYLFKMISSTKCIQSVPLNKIFSSVELMPDNSIYKIH